MQAYKTKSLENLEQKMQGVDTASLRYHILENAKSFKTSWVELGRALYSVSKDKLYKEWGYSSFDIYTSKEIGIRKQTAMKLLRSYYFLEKEEPAYLKEEYVENSDAGTIPSYESIDVLRQAKNKKGLDEEDYGQLKEKVFRQGKDAREVKKDLVSMMRQRQEVSPEEARDDKKRAVLKRLVSTLKSLKEEVELLKLLPAPVVDEIEVLLEKLQSEVD